MEILGGFEPVRDSANASCMISGWAKDAESVSALRMYSIWEKKQCLVSCIDCGTD